MSVLINILKARGLDIPAIKTVINFDVARNPEAHTHRIGRTGRAGITSFIILCSYMRRCDLHCLTCLGALDGVAYTLITLKEAKAAASLVRNFEDANQTVPQELLTLAMKDKKFRIQRSRMLNPSRHTAHAL